MLKKRLQHLYHIIGPRDTVEPIMREMSYNVTFKNNKIIFTLTNKGIVITKQINVIHKLNMSFFILIYVNFII